AIEGGVVLSGHTDVVPVEGQAWTSDPFKLTRRGDKLYGRGSSDMKGFLALALAAVPGLLAADLKRPAHLAFSYDVEIGCFGAPLKARFADAGVRVELLSDVPSFRAEADGVAEAFVRRLTGDNGPAWAVSYAAEAGQFQRGGFSTILCGPGSIDQAHQPDEWI